MYCSGFKKIIKSSLFPRKFARNSKKLQKIRYTYILGIGGNIGGNKEIKNRFEKLIIKLAKDSRFALVKSSPIIQNKAFGYEAQADFLNAVLEIKSSLYARDVLKIMLNYEKIFGRKRSFKNAPRTLDIDIIDFSAKIRQSERLRLPHPKAKERLSVILPLAMM